VVGGSSGAEALADVGLQFSGNDVILHGPSNYCATYTPNSSGDTPRRTG
jgi:hypothetical protein